MNSQANFSEVMSRLGEGLQVRHLASPITSANCREQVRDVFSWAFHLGFNNVPVQQNGEIVGVLENLLVDYPGRPSPDRAKSVEQEMRRLAGDMLLDASEPIVGLPEILLVPPFYRLVLGARGIEQIVTPSDLSKLPMRVVVFAVVTHLEAVMTGTIRRAFESDEDAVATLDQGHGAQLYEKLGGLHDKNLDPALLEVTNLRQKALILARAGLIAGTEQQVHADFTEFSDYLRNPLMHAAEYVDDSLDALRRLRELLRMARQRINEMSIAPPAPNIR